MRNAAVPGIESSYEAALLLIRKQKEGAMRRDDSETKRHGRTIADVLFAVLGWLLQTKGSRFAPARRKCARTRRRPREPCQHPMRAVRSERHVRSGGGGCRSRKAAHGQRRRSTPAAVNDKAIVNELAKVLWDPDEARLIVQGAGFPAEHIPAFRTPIVFWNSIVDAARNGAIKGKVRALVEAAASRFPGNEVFIRYRSRL